MIRAPICIIPEVRKLQLINVGPWKEVSLDFSPRINIIRNISGGRGGCGKSTIMRSLLPLADTALFSHAGSRVGSICIEYAQPNWQYALPEFPNFQADEPVSLAAGAKIMLAIGRALNQANSNCCLCFEDEVFGRLDAEKCADAIEMVNRAKWQFLIVLPSSLNPESFDSPRVFECAYDDVTESAKIQAGKRI